jgi:hypothetical protein
MDVLPSPTDVSELRCSVALGPSEATALGLPRGVPALQTCGACLCVCVCTCVCVSVFVVTPHTYPRLTPHTPTPTPQAPTLDASGANMGITAEGDGEDGAGPAAACPILKMKAKAGPAVVKEPATKPGGGSCAHSSPYSA